MNWQNNRCSLFIENNSDIEIEPPRHKENRENEEKNPSQGKYREFGYFAKTH